MGNKQTVADRAQRELAPLRLSASALGKLRQVFKEELEKGLEMHKKHGLKWVPEECSFRMLDSCVNSLPNGEETGIYYALDFGGTNIRCVRCELRGRGQISVQQNIKILSECGGHTDLMSAQTGASALFDAFAERVHDLMVENNDVEKFKEKPTKLGFTFSFPCAQTALRSSLLEAWNKGFETGTASDDPVVGKDVGELLEQALKRKSVGAECCAIINDTVGTLLSCAYQKKAGAPPCKVGVILGTGSNCCYVEPKAKEYGYTGNIINVESGNFDKGLPQTECDELIDKASSNPGRQLYEKMISGYYIGELVRLYTLRIFGSDAPEKANEEFSFSAKHAAELASSSLPQLQRTRSNLDSCKIIIKECWDWDPTDEQINVMQQIAFAVFDRSAALAAVSVVAMAERTDGLNDKGVTVGIDGSLFIKNLWYGERILHYMEIMLKSQASKINIVPADDGSGKGAAVCVAALHC